MGTSYRGDIAIDDIMFEPGCTFNGKSLPGRCCSQTTKKMGWGNSIVSKSHALPAFVNNRLSRKLTVP